MLWVTADSECLIPEASGAQHDARLQFKLLPGCIHRDVPWPGQRGEPLVSASVTAGM